MKKRTYRAVEVKSVNVEKLREQLAGQKVVVGVDMAKETPYAALRDEAGEVVLTVKWRQPQETREWVRLLQSLEAREVEVALEPSGSYGEPLRWQLWAAGIRVYRVSPKRSHDAAEVYDGVPSLHDAKSAAIVAKLHAEGASEEWPLAKEEKLELRAAVKKMDLYAQQLSRLVNQLEGELARCWPEMAGQLELDSATLLHLLQEYGGPAGVRAAGEEARELMRRVGRSLLKGLKIAQVLRGAAESTGVPQTAGERDWLRTLAREALEVKEKLRAARAEVRRLAAGHAPCRDLGTVVGLATAAVLLTEVGDPRDYPSARAYEKSAGLNLKEKSSGKHQGELKLSKRGSGRARRWLYLSVLRWLQDEEIVRRWYERKVARDGGRMKMKAVVALMRKLIRGLWHAGRGEEFDLLKLFDARRLGLAAA